MKISCWACWLTGVVLSVGGCRSSGGADATSTQGPPIEQRLAACEERLAKLEEDDRYLFAEGAADLERGWSSSACERFDTLVRRFPSSPLVAEARSHLEQCKGSPTASPTPRAAAAPAPGSPSDDSPANQALAADEAPIEVTRTWVKEDRFGVPLANVRLTNRAAKTIVGYKVALRCYDDRGTLVKHLTKGTEWFVAAGGSRQAHPGEAFMGGPWPLTGFLGTSRFETLVLSVDFEDNTSWQREDANLGIEKE